MAFAFDPAEDAYIRGKLSKAAGEGRYLSTTDDLIDYLKDEVGVGKSCATYLDTMPNPDLRDLLKEHKMMYNQCKSGPGLGRGGGTHSCHSLPHRGSFNGGHTDDSTYASGPGSLKRDGYGKAGAQCPSVAGSSTSDKFEVYLIIDGRDAPQHPLQARHHDDHGRSYIDERTAVNIYGQMVNTGHLHPVNIRWRRAVEGRVRETQCFVQNLAEIGHGDVDMVLSPEASRTGSVVDNQEAGTADDEEYKRRLTENMFRLAEHMTVSEMRKARGLR